MSRKPSGIAGLKARKILPFGWYGGKFSHLAWLLPLLPECRHYCEPFAGSGAVLLNRKPSPVETYNDLDGEVVNFFRVLRERPEAVINQLELSPFSREEFYLACVLDPNTADELERARRFFVRARQVRTGLAQTASLGRWANCKISRRDMAGTVSRWLGGIDGLPEVAQRLLRVQIENRPAVECIRLYDAPDVLFYCDPPYVHGARTDSQAYGYEMSDDDHRGLADALNAARAKVAFSNYEHPLLDELYPAERWKKLYAPEKTIHSSKAKRTEVLWVNYQ